MENVYLLDTTTNYSSIAFTTASIGIISGTYNDGTNYYIRCGTVGNYKYYKKIS